MLTVKYVDQSGIECVYPALTVQFVPQIRTESADPIADGVHVTCPDGVRIHYGFPRTGGTNISQEKVYVMNEHGKTVATYAL